MHFLCSWRFAQMGKSMRYKHGTWGRMWLGDTEVGVAVWTKWAAAITLDAFCWIVD